MKEIVDIKTAAIYGTLFRTATLQRSGIFRLARRDCELYSVMISSSGSWGRARLMDASGRALWYQPSTFTGSFVLQAGADEGLLAELFSEDLAPMLSVTWREQDGQVI